MVFKLSVTEDFHFEVPPEAPVYSPTVEEFSDPLTYIAKIRDEAQNFGICRIKPPPDWQPPFAVDVDKFKFTPRIQRLNELEAKTRIKLNFLDQIAKFWELQGSSLKMPMVERRILDLYQLHRNVEMEGGFKVVTNGRKWAKIAVRMGLNPAKDIGSTLKQHYERILYPFDVFKQGEKLSDIKSEQVIDEEPPTSLDGKKKETDYKPHGIVSRQAIKPPRVKYARRSTRNLCKGKGDVKKTEPTRTTRSREVKKGLALEYDPLAKYVCHACGRGDVEENMLLCDGCDDSLHTFCLVPPLAEIPKGDWRCPRCVAMEVSKPMEAFGFEQAQREYTLQQFGEMADYFKSAYFNRPVHMIQGNLIEREFWRIMSTIEEEVTVEYGADLHTMDHGSGFPTQVDGSEIEPSDLEYAKSNWNLNNLPNLENSVLGHINVDISGMKIPWMYVGMCFATFCWHNEDHWSYSINYLHWGEPKTWYGVPGGKAEAFEDSMKSAAPELFATQPDLLHQLVTIMNPNILMEAGVPVYRTDQKAGEFVITFPRAYHAGFNQGYNFAEAVNFATPDWLQVGRQCVDHYSMLRRYCVFSHDELICKMASTPKILDLTVAKATYEDMMNMVQTEKKLRKILLEWGVTEAEREAFELLPDDERQCEVCKTTCFLSAVTCSCTSDQLVCLRHCVDLCRCPPEKHTLRYRYTLDELPAMLDNVKLRAECYDEWCDEVRKCLDPEVVKTHTLAEMKDLLARAHDIGFPNDDLLQAFSTAVVEAEKCATIAQQLVNKKVRTRTRQTAESKYKLTIEELSLFFEEIESLCCILKERDDIKDLLDKVTAFQEQTKPLLELNDLENIDSVALEKCIDAGSLLDVDLPEIKVLKQNLQRVTWLEEVFEIKEDEAQVTIDALRSLLSSGVELPPHPLIEKQMADLQLLLMNVEKWEEKAKEGLTAKPRQPISVVENILKEAEEIPAFLPNEGALKDALKKAKEWISKVESFEGSSDFPYLETLESLVNKGRFISVRLDLLPLFETKLESAKAWKERTARTFLRKNSRYTLMEALSPRTEFGINVLKLKKKKSGEENSHCAPTVFDVKLEGNVSPVAVVAAFKHAERQEMASMRDLRLQNLRKRATDNGDIRYCICRRGATGFMLQCELCKDWFHASCVPLPKNAGAKSKQSPAQQLAAAATREVKFLCPCCLRSRRPRLETILALLVSLQKLEVRVPEGEALQCLTERAMNWQDRARNSLNTEEIANALAKLSVLSQKLVEAAAREKTEKIITSELKKAAGKIGNPELHRRVRAMSGVSTNEDSPNTPGWLSGDSGDHSQQGFTVESQEVKTERDDDGGGGTQGGYFSGNSEHAYSTASKTPLIKHQKQPPLVLSEIARAELEELMLEGDLLEVSLDETTHIWRILQATKSKPEKERYPPMDQLESELLASKVEKDRLKMKQRVRSSRVEEMEAQQSMKVKKTKTKTSFSPPRMPFPSEPIPSIASSPQRKPRKLPPKPVKEIPKKKIMKRRTHEIEKKNVVKRKKRIERETSSESDSDENCAARKCLKPTGKEVDWVQCDGGCEKWFHFRCIGVDKKDIRDDEDFICDKCDKIRMMVRPPLRHPPMHPSHIPMHHPLSHHSSHHSGHHDIHGGRVKVEPTNLDESMGLDALLSLANAVPDNDPNLSLEGQNSGWVTQQGFNYDMEEPRGYHGIPQIPTRTNLNIAAPLSNPPELLLTPTPNPPSYPMQEPYPPAMEQHGKMSEQQYPPYGIPDVMPYGPPEGQFSTQYPTAAYPVQNYPHPSVFPYPGNYQEQYQDSYVLTQLTEPSKPNYAVQSYPIHEPTYQPQPDFPRIFAEEAPKADVKKGHPPLSTSSLPPTSSEAVHPHQLPSVLSEQGPPSED